MTATLYAAASCRFLVVTFRSETGDFEDFFSNLQNAEAGRPTAEYKAGVGLFQWLRPFSKESLWSDGSCAGYQESMLQQISDTMFETARFFGVLAIVFSFVIVIGTLQMFCLEFNRLQIILFCFIAMMGTFCCGMTFMLTKSALCDGLFLESQCELDEGGLVMIAGALLWLATFVLSAVFMRPSNSDTAPRLSKSERSKIAAEIERQERLKKKGRTSSTPDTNKAYSFDSSMSDDESRIRRVRDRRASSPESRMRSPSSSRARSTELSSRSFSSTQLPEYQLRFANLKPHTWKRDSSKSNRITKDNIIIDDVSQPDSMEVYISNRLDHTRQISKV